MSKSEMLFWTGHGSSALEGHVADVAGRARSVPDDQVLTGDLDQLAAQIGAQGSVRVPALDRENISFSRGKRTIERENMWGERSRGEQAVVYFEVPFDGEKDIFKLRPNQFDTSPPYAEVRQNSLVITVPDNNDPEVVKREVNSTLDDIERYLSWHKPLWEGVEGQIVRQARDILQSRKSRLEQERSSDDALSGFGFKPKP